MNRIRQGMALAMCCALGIFHVAVGQDTLHSPLTIPLKFSGNFGEIRTGHFHTGMDIRTEGKEGIPVLAAQAGKVSRIKVSHRGYGLALYLDGGGLTTVYAHLSAFHPEIESWLKNHQYRKEKWAYDGKPDMEFRFNRGDTLGWSGNTGGSSGPHLHFEVRDARNQHPINPLHWSFIGEGVAEDQIPPEFRGVWVVPEPGATVEGAAERFKWTPAYAEGVRTAGPFSLGVEGFDRLAKDGFIHDPYGIDVWLGESLVHSHRMDTLDFSNNGDVSAHIDLPQWQDRKGRVHRVQRLPGNRLDIYRKTSGVQPFVIAPGDSSRLRVSLLDIFGNTTDVAMWIHGDSVLTEQSDVGPEPLDRAQSHHLVDGDMEVDIPANALYADAIVDVEQEGNRFRVESEARRTQSDYTLTVPVPEDKVGSNETLILCAVDGKGRVGGTWVADERNGRLSARLDRFGVFEVRVDTSPPVLGKPKLKQGVISISVNDDLSGISRWEGRCGDQWLRWSRDKSLLAYSLDDGMLEGKEDEEVKVWAIDNAGNIGHITFRLRDLLP